MNLLNLHKRRRSVPRRQHILLFAVAACAAAFFLYCAYVGLYVYRSYSAAKALEMSVQRVQIYAQDADIVNVGKELGYTKNGITNLRWALSHLGVFSYMPYIGTQYDAALQLLDIGEALVVDAQQGLTVVEEVFDVLGNKNIESIRDVSEVQKGQIFEIIKKNNGVIKEIAADMQIHANTLNTFDTTALTPVLGDAVIRLKDPIQRISDILSTVVPLLDQAPAMLGFPKQQTYLFLMQNNTEVRATGGFIGNYGILKVHNGEIKEFHTDNIYNIDDPAAAYLRVDPPAPFYRFFTTNRYWFLRDSNWSPDFSESAKKAMWFYEKQGGKERLDGVIAITQDFIIPFLRFTGPIEVEGIVFTADNFEQELQYQVEKGYYQKGIPESQRKEIIGDLSDKIMERLYQLHSSRFSDVLSIAHRMVEERQLLMYFADPHLQEYARSQNWTGEFRKTDDDFVMVVDSNMGALKTDIVMEKYIDYSLFTAPDGSLHGKVDLNYINNGVYTWFTTRYKDWVRIYVPAGSTLVRSEGAMEKELSPEVGKVEIGKELDKTYFGAYIVVEPRSKKHFSVEYRLPDRIAQQIRNGRYHLTVQKQSGVSSQQFKGKLSFPRPVKTYGPAGFFNTKTDAQSVQFQSDLRVDRFFSVTF